MDPGAYCRSVESYLCRQNDGHLIRIVGPAFDLVCGWAALQIPLRVVRRGIDRTFERYYAKGPRRRPVRIEFCEADVLEAFDEWRRAVGVGTAGGDPERSTEAGRRLTLSAHIARVVSQLSAHHPADATDHPLDADAVKEIVGELVTLQERAKKARGKAREALVMRLTEIDTQVTTAVREQVAPAEYQQLQAEAARDLEPYRERMPPAAFSQAKRAGADRLLHERFRLPRIAFD